MDLRMKEVVDKYNRVLHEKIDGEYIDIWPTGSACLDGNFSSQQLREIADAMDALAKEIADIEVVES